MSLHLVSEMFYNCIRYCCIVTVPNRVISNIAAAFLCSFYVFVIVFVFRLFSYSCIYVYVSVGSCFINVS